LLTDVPDSDVELELLVPPSSGSRDRGAACARGTSQDRRGHTNARAGPGSPLGVEQHV